MHWFNWRQQGKLSLDENTTMHVLSALNDVFEFSKNKNFFNTSFAISKNCSKS